MKNHSTFSYLVIVSFLILFGCKGEEGPVGPQGSQGEQGIPGLDGTSDKQIRINFDPSIFTMTADTIWNYPNSSTYLIKFNINNYTNVDSIIFAANMGSFNTNTNCIVELFNITDNVEIQGSTLITNSDTKFPGLIYGGIWCQTQNILDKFPNKDIDLSIRIKSSRNGTDVNVNRGILLVYRNK